jgi:electron transfer flavoprotein beta subunit
MRIIVLAKQVPSPRERVTLKANGTIDRERAKAVTNPYDKHALEAALQLKDKLGAHITVISMGPPQAIEVLREALAMGADEGILLSDRKLVGSDTLATSYALAGAIQRVGKFDLILCGMETTDGNTGQVGPEVAEHLGIPQITYVEQFKVVDGQVVAKRLIEGGFERVRTALPVLLTITNTANEPRYPSVLGVIAATRRGIPTWTVADLAIDEARIGLEGSPTKLKRIDRPPPRGECRMFRGEDVTAVVAEFLAQLKRDGISLR